MRLTWKLALLIAVGIGAQMLLNRHADDMDEARFTFHVFVAHLCGGTAADPDVMDMAVDLHVRKMQRAGYAVRHTQAGTTDFEDEAEVAPPVRVNASGLAN